MRVETSAVFCENSSGETVNIFSLSYWYKFKMETRSVITENTSRRTVSHGESYSSVSTSYSTSSEPFALMVEDVTIKQIATARETFSDLETAYRKFKLELENVKEEHRSEV